MLFGSMRLEFRYGMTRKKKRHEDTSISLHPLSFEEAMKELARTPKQKDSEAEEFGNTTEDVPESAPSKKRTSRRP